MFDSLTLIYMLIFMCVWHVPFGFVECDCNGYNPVCNTDTGICECLSFGVTGNYCRLCDAASDGDANNFCFCK